MLEGIDLTTILYWLAAGGIAGLIAWYVIPGDAKGGPIAAMAIALVGGLIGGLLGERFIGAQAVPFNATPLLLALAGGLVVVVIQKLSLHETKQFRTEKME
jgi:uncharacterized membrane protein YeaQ/YmgE (transglycosylase-associated protein family)